MATNAKSETPRWDLVLNTVRSISREFEEIDAMPEGDKRDEAMERQLERVRKFEGMFDLETRVRALTEALSEGEG